MATKIKDLSMNLLVKDADSKYYGKPVVWMVVAKNHSGYPSNSVTLVTEKVMSIKCYDAQEHNSSGDQRTGGFNNYKYSNIRQWLNSTAAVGAWYSPQHSTDAPPSIENCGNRNNPYDKEAGFLNGFSSNFRSALLTTNLTFYNNTNYETLSDKMFVLSGGEISDLSGGEIKDGIILSGIGRYRTAYPTEECVNQNQGDSAISTNRACSWWTRTPQKNSTSGVYTKSINENQFGWDAACISNNIGVRPACNISGDTYVSDTKDSDGAYTIIWGKPPTNPPSITLPDVVHGGKELTVTWGASTDPDNNLSGYILERAFNGTTRFTQIYKGSARSYKDTVLAEWENVTYRVKAYDTTTIESGYTTSETRNVLNNTTPVISGQNENLGLKTSAFTVTYTVTDPDADQTITVVEMLDGKQKRSYTAVSGENNSFEITGSEWIEILNGIHKITITATDNYDASDTREYTFTKNQTRLEFTLANPVATEEMITKAILNCTRQIAPGAKFTVEICNNAYDTAPVWEDVTNLVLNGSKIFFGNKTKTADQWGFNLRVKVERNGAEGDCRVSSIGGNFE